MKRYIARQSIYDDRDRVAAYELLYRDQSEPNRARIWDGDQATRDLLSDAITVFGLPRLTDGKPAFVNFTENLILSDLALLACPKEIVLEILETIRITLPIKERLVSLKEQGYRLALDDYTGDPRFHEILPLVDIVKLDFRLTDAASQRRLVRQIRSVGRARLLAEKVETEQEYQRALQLGCTLFQGYYFETPQVFHEKTVSISGTAYGALLAELISADVDLDRCAYIIHTDTTLTYHILRRAGTLRYYRGNSIQVLQQALMMIGTDELQKMTALFLLRSWNSTRSNELVRDSYRRGLFTERLIERSPWASRSGDGFLLGMFSLLDQIMGVDLEQVLTDIPLSTDVRGALLGNERNPFSPFLDYLLVYEGKDPSANLPPLEIDISEDEAAHIYMECIAAADQAMSEYI